MSGEGERSEFAHATLVDECYGDRAVADLLTDETANPEAKKFFAGRVAQHREAEADKVHEAARKEIAANPENHKSEFYSTGRKKKVRD